MTDDLTALVPTTPPEGIVAFALHMPEAQDQGALIYSCEWVTDTSVDAALSDRPRKVRAVRCTCSLCNASFLADYAPPQPAYLHGGFHRTYGAVMQIHGGMATFTEYDTLDCPFCGGMVQMLRASTVGDGWTEIDKGGCMSAAVLEDPSGERPLALLCWAVKKFVDRRGNEHFRAVPAEAYVFGAHEARYLKTWYKAPFYEGLHYRDEWREYKRWSEDWGSVPAGHILGLTPELVEESDLPNCKLDRYMEPLPFAPEARYPVSWLRLYQEHPAVENLVTQGAGPILHELMDEKIDRYTWQHNKRGLPDLCELDLAARRPSQMLRLDRDEFARCKAQRWGLYHWKVYVAAKLVGDRMTDRDIEDLHRYGGDDILPLVGKAPVGKICRYLLRQCMEWGAENDPYNEYADYQPDEDVIDAVMLGDYWNMAERAGWDLSDPGTRWPRTLITAHDKATEAWKAVKAKGLKKQFAARKKQLWRYAWTDGDILIRPAASQADLNRESAGLQHCVKTYGEDHALGKSAIYFIRRVETPDEPWYTLELDEAALTVRQNRGLRNCARTPEVQDFEERWLRWVKAGARRTKKNDPANLPKPGKKKAAAAA